MNVLLEWMLHGIVIRVDKEVCGQEWESEMAEEVRCEDAKGKKRSTRSFLLLSDFIKGKNCNLFTVFSVFTEVMALLWNSFLSLGSDMA